MMEQAIQAVRFKMAEYGTAVLQDADIENSLWQGYIQFCRDTDAVLSPTYETTTADNDGDGEIDDEYKLSQFANGTRTAKNIYRIVYLSYNGSPCLPVPKRTASAAEMLDGSETGVPSWWTTVGRNAVKLFPRPTKAGDKVRLRGYETPVKNQDEFMADVPDYYLDAVVNWACADLASRVVGDETSVWRASKHMAAYQAQVNQARREFRMTDVHQVIAFSNIFRT